MRRVVAVVRTKRIILRVSHRPRREISSVHRVNRSRECCTRKPLGKLLSSSSASLCITLLTTILVCTFLSRSRSTCSVSIGKHKCFLFPALFDFEHRIELTVHYDFHCLSECRFEVNLDAQVAILYQVAERPVARVQGEV